MPLILTKLILTNISLPLENIATLFKVHVIDRNNCFKKSQNHLVLTSYTVTFTSSNV